MADRSLFPHVRAARLLVGKWYRFTLAFLDLRLQPPPAELPLQNCTSELGVTDPETKTPGPDAYPCTGYWLPTAGRPWGISMTS